jgi:hypothetical protein
MSNRFMISVAAAALIAGTGFANAQGTGTTREAPAAGAATQQSAPPSAATPMNRNDASQSGAPAEAPKADAPKAAQSKDMAPKGEKSAQDNMKGEKGAAGKDMKADSKGAADAKSTTTGQAGAGAKLSTEQRTKITTVIKSQNVRPVTNVNFSISVGTRVPRDVGFHPLPAEIVTIYPEWRGYEFFLVGNQIIVVNPRTLEIVDVIDA